MRKMKTLLALLTALAAAPGCGGGGAGGPDPVAKMFDAPYSAFLTATGAQKAGCSMTLKVSGEAGKKTESLASDVEVDPAGSVYVTRDGFQTVRVGGTTWQRPDASARWEKVESGGRAEQVRDDAVVGWRALLAPYRTRLHLKRSGSKKLGKREVEVYELTGDAGGTADGPKLQTAAGQVGLDAETGFPVLIDFRGGWETPAPERKAGRVQFEAEKLHCEVESLSPGQLIPAPTGSAVTTPPPLSAATPTATPTPKKKKH